MDKTVNDYDASSLRRMETPKMGMTLPAKVTIIVKDKLSALLDADTLTKWEVASHEQDFLSITVEYEGGKASTLLPYPTGGVFHPRSKLGRWERKFGAVPVLGQDVCVTADANGFYRLDV